MKTEKNENSKNQIKPDYYDSFHCIADKCSMTCCKEWKIAVDDLTYKKWKKLGMKPKVHKQAGERVITLNEKMNCPYLDENKLCKLVILYGEDILSDTCATFPRQVHHFQDRTEYSLVSCCPAVVDIWQENENAAFQKLFMTESAHSDDLPYRIRLRMMEILQDEGLSVTEGLLVLFFFALDLLEAEEKNELQLCMEKYGKDEWIMELRQAIEKAVFSRDETENEGRELFLDVAENYRREGLYADLLEPLAKLAEAEEIEEAEQTNWDKTKSQENQMELGLLAEFSKQFHIYDSLFRNFLVAELFTNLLLPEADLESMVVKLQWIAMEYAVIREALYLQWKQEPERKLSYETVRTYLVLISRMTGYEEDDIYEYLENSFESMIWDWGYFALIIGKE
ncbi:MAG: flagellin lysine-N-methylase [Lachnospiraceae bacterium]|nr:flagellin lysine-N-methylase [Lachnospiraceae bacterium]